MAAAAATRSNCIVALQKGQIISIDAHCYEWNVDNFNGMDLILIENFFITQNNWARTHAHALTHKWNCIESGAEQSRAERFRASNRFDGINTKGRLLYGHVVSTTCLLCSNCSSNISFCVLVIFSTTAAAAAAAIYVVPVVVGRSVGRFRLVRYAHFNITSKWNCQPNSLMPKKYCCRFFIYGFMMCFLLEQKPPGCIHTAQKTHTHTHAQKSELKVSFSLLHTYVSICDSHLPFGHYILLFVIFEWFDFVRHTHWFGQKIGGILPPHSAMEKCRLEFVCSLFCLQTYTVKRGQKMRAKTHTHREGKRESAILIEIWERDVWPKWKAALST